LIRGWIRGIVATLLDARGGFKGAEKTVKSALIADFDLSTTQQVGE